MLWVSARATGRTTSTTGRRCSTSPTPSRTTQLWPRSPKAARAPTRSRAGRSTPTRRSRRCATRRFASAIRARQIEQTFRFFDTTTENTVRLSADATGINWLTLRAVYEHGKAHRLGVRRAGARRHRRAGIAAPVRHLRPHVRSRLAHRASDAGVVRSRSTARVGRQGGSAGSGVRPAQQRQPRLLGRRRLRAACRRCRSARQYSSEKYTSLQASRQANPGAQFNDPTRDWTTDGERQGANTFTASMDLLKLWPKTDIRVCVRLQPRRVALRLRPAAEFHARRRSSSCRRSSTNSSGRRWMCGITSRDTSARASSTGTTSTRVNDFALGTQTLTTIAQPSFLMIGYLAHPYTANTLSGRFTCTGRCTRPQRRRPTQNTAVALIVVPVFSCRLFACLSSSYTPAC